MPARSRAPSRLASSSLRPFTLTSKTRGIGHSAATRSYACLLSVVTSCVTWNISLFHYRNHGADFGRVLAGFEVPASESAAFEEFLQSLGYIYQRERDNPAYRMFLGS